MSIINGIHGFLKEKFPDAYIDKPNDKYIKIEIKRGTIWRYHIRLKDYHLNVNGPMLSTTATPSGKRHKINLNDPDALDQLFKVLNNSYA